MVSGQIMPYGNVGLVRKSDLIVQTALKMAAQYAVQAITKLIVTAIVIHLP